jgi:outer membrane usher protein
MVKRARERPGVARTSMAAITAMLAATPVTAQTSTARPETNPQNIGPSAADADFDSLFFRHAGGPVVDVSRFARGNPVPAGRYLIDLNVNGVWIARTEILFKSAAADGSPAPCLDQPTLDRLGADLGKIAPAILSRLRVEPDGCLPLSELLPAATFDFDTGEQTLEIRLPQAALRHNPRGYIDPQLWSEGVTSARLGYNFNLFHTEGRYGATQAYLGLDMGLNIGAWRFRHDGALTAGSGRAVRYNGIRTYAQRDITALRSQLLVGDAFTSGDLFDSIGFRGISLKTDERMLPESQRGYAPVVRGTARTNANIVIRQNGNLIYQATVSSGPFEINDLYATGFGGDLVVTVQEADGRNETFTVPFASIPQLLRRGTTRFSATVGQVRNYNGDYHPLMLEATLQRGLSNALTGFAGTVVAGRYRSALAGVALNTRFGAIGADLTLADAGLSGIDSRGASFRLSYSRLWSATGTNFTVAAYRYSSKGFWTLQDALQAHRRPHDGSDFRTIDRRRDAFQVNLTQTLGPRWGSFYLTAATQLYWNRPGRDTSYQAGYSNRYSILGYTFGASRQTDTLTGRHDNRFMLSLNLPLGRGTHSPSMSSIITATGDRPFQTQTTLSGVAGSEDNLSWNTTFAHQGSDNSVSGTVQSRTRIGNLTAGAGIGNGYRQGSIGASGTVLLHSGGVTLGLPGGDSIGILHAPGAQGAEISSTPGVRVDGRGYAIVPYLTPYARNTIDIDPKGLGLDVELTETRQTVTPRAGAVVPVRFDSVVGRAGLITARTDSGGVVPFGAEVLSAKGEVIGQAGQAGRIFIRGIADSGALIVRWGDAEDEQCRLDYRLSSASAGATTIAKAEGVCSAVARNQVPTNGAAGTGE